MDEQLEWWRILTRLSPILIPIASAVVALLIRDLLEPRQWQRYVRKTLASAFAGVFVFAVIIGGYLLLVQRAGEDSLLVGIAVWVVGLGTLPATAFAVYLVFNRVEPNLDWFLNSRFVFSFQNGSWPTLSMDVRSECLPEGATSISGCIAATRENVDEFHLRVVVGTGSDTRTILDGTTRNPRYGWMRVMRTALEAQLGDPKESRGWQERIYMYSRLRDWFKILTRAPAPTASARYKWQNDAYIQIHSLARMVNARGVLS